MKFALVDGCKTEPQPKLRGTCAHCQSETISKCGNFKVWHWAHKSKVSCDLWWENETEWHRAWKSRFPIDWQEISHLDPLTREKHIADVKTAGGYIIEFQHSSISLEEVRSREAFYRNMVWLVDGTRLKRDYPRFLKETSDFRQSIQNGFFLVHFPQECFPASWLDCSVPVYFDFRGASPIDKPDMIRDALWCLFPGRLEGCAVVAAVSREQFVELASNNPQLLLADQIRNNIALYIKQQREIEAIRARRLVYPQYTRRRRYRRF